MSSPPLHPHVSDKHIVVTGGCGFFGAWIVSKLLASGARVTIVDAVLSPARLALTMSSEEIARVTLLQVRLYARLMRMLPLRQLSPQENFSPHRPRRVAATRPPISLAPRRRPPLHHHRHHHHPAPRLAQAAIDEPSFVTTLAGLRPDGVIHLAALQMPMCKAQPLLGARVNVVGHLAIFEAARAMLAAPVGVAPAIVYASSAAVFGPDAEYGDAAAGDLAVPSPRSHYGAFKLCCEFASRAYALSDGIASVGLRPLTVYGPGRDVGLTSAPTRALAAAVRGEPFDIPFSGATAYIHVAEVADMFIACLRQERGAGPSEALARIYTVGGDTVDVPAFIALAAAAIPGADKLITCSGAPLPLVSKLDDAALRRDYPVPRIALADGVRQTADAYRALHAQGKLKV